MAGRRAARAASRVFRLPSEGDHPVRWTLAMALVFGGWGFLLSVAPNRGLGLSPAWGLVIGAIVALVVAVPYGFWVRRAPRRQALRVGPEGITFADGRTDRWTIAWDDVRSARIVDGSLGRRGERRCSFLQLDLEPGSAPDDRSLHHHEGTWWFPILASDVPAVLHHELERWIPGRVRRARSIEKLPWELQTR